MGGDPSGSPCRTPAEHPARVGGSAVVEVVRDRLVNLLDARTARPHARIELPIFTLHTHLGSRRNPLQGHESPKKAEHQSKERTMGERVKAIAQIRRFGSRWRRSGPAEDRQHGSTLQADRSLSMNKLAGRLRAVGKLASVAGLGVVAGATFVARRRTGHRQ